MGEENHNLCCVFFTNSAKSPVYYSIQLVNSSRHGAVGGASAWQTRGCGFEPLHANALHFSRKISRCLAGVLFLKR